MNDYDALLAAVLANPEDDVPRLVFADWMEESGQPALVARAHFIRAQVESAQLPEGDPDRAACERKADDLYREYGAGWNAVLPGWVTWNDTSLRYSRGFVSELGVTPRRLFRDAYELMAVAPIDTVHIRTDVTAYTPAHLRTFIKDLPWLARVRTLRLGSGLWVRRSDQHSDPADSPELFLLSHLRKLTGVRCLILSQLNLNDEWVVGFVSQFTKMAFAASLRELDLSRNQVSDAGAHTLAAARGLDQFQRLDLRDNRVTTSGSAMLRRRFGDRVEL